VTGIDPTLVDVLLVPQSGGAGRDIQPDAAGLYVFDNLPAGQYTVQIAIKSGGYVFPPPQTVQVSGDSGSAGQANFALVAKRPAAFAPIAPPAAAPDLVFFPPVQHSLRGPFLRYWQAHGGLPVFGYPLDEEFQETSATDGKTYTVQYFQRNRFEYHPEFAGTANEVLLGLLGVDVARAHGWLP
jgi:hypothetical protein